MPSESQLTAKSSFMTKMFRKSVGLPVLLLLLLSPTIQSCFEGIAYEKNYSIVDASWASDDSLFFEFEIADTSNYHDVFFVFRIDNEYPFSNLYAKVHLDGPQGQKITELKAYELADMSGKWRGKSYSGLINFEFPIFKEMEFRQGVYKMTLLQYMRIKSIPGVHDIGIKIVKGDPLL